MYSKIYFHQSHSTLINNSSSYARQKEPISPLSPKVVEELASLRWELQERQRTAMAMAMAMTLWPKSLGKIMENPR